MKKQMRQSQSVRLEYFLSRQFSGQGIKGIDKTYSDLQETYQIVVLGNRKFFYDEVLVHVFQYYDPVNCVSLKGKTRIITVELLKADIAVDKPASEMSLSESWSVFFQYLTDPEKRGKINEILKKEAEIGMAGETLMEISKDEIEQARLTTELKNILDYQCMMIDAKREGLKEGREEGHAEGHAEGRAEERQYVLELLDQGLSTEEKRQHLSKEA